MKWWHSPAPSHPFTVGHLQGSVALQPLPLLSREVCQCVQGLVRGGSVPCWVTFEGSPAKIAPRSPLHDSWASPSDLSPFEAQLQRGPGCAPGCGTVRKLQLEPSVEEAAEYQPQAYAGEAYPQQRGEPVGAPQVHHVRGADYLVYNGWQGLLYAGTCEGFVTDM